MFKKLLSVMSVAAIMAVITTGAFAAGPDLSKLCSEMLGIFKLLRNLAFIGAAFVIAGWAWGYISAGKIDKPLEDAKTKGIALIIGFLLLTSIGTVMSIFTNSCVSGWK